MSRAPSAFGSGLSQGPAHFKTVLYDAEPPAAPAAVQAATPVVQRVRHRAAAGALKLKQQTQDRLRRLRRRAN